MQSMQCRSLNLIQEELTKEERKSSQLLRGSIASLIEAKLRVVRIGRRVDRAASHDAEKGVQRHVCQALEINRVQPVILPPSSPRPTLLRTGRLPISRLLTLPLLLII